MCWWGGASGEWEGPGCAKPRVKRKDGKLGGAIIQSAFRRDDSDTGRTNGLEDTLGAKRPAVKAGAEARNKLETASAAAEAPRNGPYRMGWRRGGSGCGEEKPRSQDDAQVRGLTGKLGSAAKARETMLVEEGAESLLSFPRNHAGDRIYLCV